jgi:hypothetical protein
MAVGVDDRRHRLVAQVLAREIHGIGGRFARGERIHHDPARLALDQGDVGEVEAAQLPDALRDLEQSDMVVELRLAPQAGMGGDGCVALQEGKTVEVPQHPAIGILDLPLGNRDQATGRIGKSRWIGPIVGRLERLMGFSTHAAAAVGRRF